MEGTTWTNERLDDLATAMREGFARVDTDIRDMRKELREEIGSVRSDLGADIGSLRSDLGARIDRLNATMLRVGGGVIIALIGVIAAVLAGGV